MLHTYSLIYSPEPPDHPGAWKSGAEREGPTRNKCTPQQVGYSRPLLLYQVPTNLSWGTKGDTG